MRMRDLLVLDTTGRLVIACDSIGGIGPKPADRYWADAPTVAHFALRGPLLEVLCTGAEVIAIANALTVARDDIGQQMIDTIVQLAQQAGVSAEAVTGSTEENVPSGATGVGVTVIGRLPPGAPAGGESRPGDVVLCAGLPISAPRDRVHIGHPSLVSVGEVSAALATGVVHDALPVGSKGVRFEIGQLAEPAGLTAIWQAETVHPTDSGGPSSCVLFSCAAADEPILRAVFSSTLPVERVAPRPLMPA